MGEFFAELRRRRIYRIGAGYVIVAWAITQLIDVLSQIFALPDWIAQPVLVVLAIGFPVTLVVAWLIGGEPKQSATMPATTVDWVLAGGLVLVLGVFGIQSVSRGTTEISLVDETDDAAAAIASEIVEDVSGRLPNSIAVLPFENFSPDPDRAYFAMGVHDQILSKLSLLENVNVIARTSVQQYPGSGKTIPEIADELNVEMVMEGSVSYAGEDVRVTAQLIDGETNTHLWTEDYNGNLSDIFGIQADIAMRIANSLQAEFSVREQGNIESQPTASPEAYEAFLRAMALVQGDINGEGAVNDRRIVQNYLDQALEFDPSFALAYAWKARVYYMSRRFDPILEEDWPAFAAEMDQLVQLNINTALTLDPNVGLAHAVRAGVLRNQNRWDEARAEADLALQSSPNDVEVLFLMSFFERDFGGQPEQALRYAERALALDPNTAQRYDDLGNHLRLSGRYDEAVGAYQDCLSRNPADTGCSRGLAQAEFLRGNSDAALNALRHSEAGQGTGSLTIVAWGYGRLERLDDARRIFTVLQERTATQYIDPTRMAKAHLGIGDYDEALRLLTLAADNPELIKDHLGKEIVAGNDWHDPMLEEPAFLEVRRRLGFR